MLTFILMTILLQVIHQALSKNPEIAFVMQLPVNLAVAAIAMGWWGLTWQAAFSAALLVVSLVLISASLMVLHLAIKS